LSLKRKKNPLNQIKLIRGSDRKEKSHRQTFAKLAGLTASQRSSSFTIREFGPPLDKPSKLSILLFAREVVKGEKME